MISSEPNPLRPVKPRLDASSLRDSPFVVLCFAVGIFFRLDHYLDNRSLWLDEAYLSINILRRSFEGLLQPLDYFQSAPKGFLLATKLLVESWGESQYVLRFLPLVAGIASLYLLWRLLAQIISAQAALTGLALFSVIPSAIYYSAEVKQYSCDVAATLALYIFLARLPEKWDLRDLPMITLAGVAAPWFSHASSFVLAGIGLTLAIYFVVRRDWMRLLHTFIICATWLISFAISISSDLGGNAATLSHMQDHWHGAFMPLPPTSWPEFKWTISALPVFLRHPVGVFWGPGVLLWVLGLVSLWKHNRRWLLFLVLPFFIALMASAARVYPFRDRFLLFLVPGAVILMTAGLEFLRAKTPAFVWLCALALLLSKPLASSSIEGADAVSHERHDVRTVVRELKDQFLSGHGFYVLYHSRAQVEYYTRRFGVDTDTVIYEGREGEELEMLRGAGPVWVIYSEVLWDDVQEKLRLLDSMGERVGSIDTAGAGAYLYNFRQAAGRE